MRIRAEDQVRAFHFGLVGQIHLLRKAHVRHQEDHGALLVIAQNADVLRHVHLRLGERDAIAVRG